MSENTERTRREALQLEQKFIDLLTDTQSFLSCKESENLRFFKTMQFHLINCQLSAKFKHVSVLKEEENRIREAANLEELFKIFHPYWNWVNYDLLESLVKNFKDYGLKRQLTEYLFELDTFIANFEEAVTYDGRLLVTTYRVEVEMKLERNPGQFTLHDVRILKRDIESHTALTPCALMMKHVVSSSVRIFLVYPLLALELLPPAIDKEFRASHNIVSITIMCSGFSWIRGSLEDINVHVSVSVSSDT